MSLTPVNLEVEVLNDEASMPELAGNCCCCTCCNFGCDVQEQKDNAELVQI